MLGSFVPLVYPLLTCIFFRFTACRWAGEGQQHKFTLGLASVAAGLKCVGNMGSHVAIVSTLDSQICGGSSGFFFVNWR